MPSVFLTSTNSSEFSLGENLSNHLSIEEQQATEDIVSLSSPPTSPSSIGFSEERERRIFLGELNKFMMDLGKPFNKIPIMGYKELDLFQLFKEVISYGGFNEVVKNVGTWSKIWKRLGNFDPSITDSSFRLKKNYERYLLEYEFKCFPENRQQTVDAEDNVGASKRSQNEGSQEMDLSSISSLSLSSSGSKRMISYENTELSKYYNNNHSGNSSFSTTCTSSSSSTTTSSSSSSNNSNNSSNSSNSSNGKKNSKNKPKRRSQSFSDFSLTSIEQAMLPLKMSSSSWTMPEIARDSNGVPLMPLLLGDLTIENLGVVIPRSPYVTEKHIWPIGFTSHRYLPSITNPELRVKYTCQIVDIGGRPQFLVDPSDHTGPPMSYAYSPSAAWNAVMVPSNQPSSLGSREPDLGSGSARFGLIHPVVVRLLRELLVSALEASPATGVSGSFARSHSNRKRKFFWASDPGNLLKFSATTSSSSSSDDNHNDNYNHLKNRMISSVGSGRGPSPETEDHVPTNGGPLRNGLRGRNRIRRSCGSNDRLSALDQHCTSSELSHYFSERDVCFATRDEMDDLESAVATLHSFKYCAVF